MPDVYVDIFEFPDGTQVHFKDDRVDNLPKPMVYKGTLGTGGTITTLPVDGSATVGDTYKVITAGTYAGVDADIGDMFVCQTKTSSANTWDHIPSGDDQGGHEIADDTGTILPQEPVMQFVGTYSEDDNTNNKTKVNVVRSMIKNQFDQLSEAEKKGFINITDVTSGSDDRFQPVIYSLDEREIGVWTDGKPLYQRTVKINALPSSASLVDYPHGISDIDTICESWGYIHWASGNIAPLNTMQFSGSSTVSVGASFFYLVSKTNVSIQTGMDRHTSSATVTIRYTKTTDTAGSGQWTPQGVPAHHYSTDEQVVGTWIDGSTLYQTTLQFNLPSTANWTKAIQHDLNIDTYVSYSGFIKTSSVTVAFSSLDPAYNSMFYFYPNNIYTTTIGNNALSQSCIMTLRYTKTSS